MEPTLAWRDVDTKFMANQELPNHPQGWSLVRSPSRYVSPSPPSTPRSDNVIWVDYCQYTYTYSRVLSCYLEQKLIEISSPERWPILFLLLHFHHPWVEASKTSKYPYIFPPSTRRWRKWRSKNKMGHLSGQLISISFCSKFVLFFGCLRSFMTSKKSYLALKYD